MRLKIPEKILFGFIGLFLVTAFMAVILLLGINGLKASTEQIGQLKDFKFAVSTVESLNWGPKSRSPAGNGEEVKRQFSELAEKISIVANIGGGLPEPLQKELRALKDQGAFFEKAYGELLTQHARDVAIHDKSHGYLNAIISEMENQSPSAQKASLHHFKELFGNWYYIYHEHDPNAVYKYRELALKVSESNLDEKTKKAFSEMMINEEQGYLNFLAILETEQHLESTSKRFAELADISIASVQAHVDSRHRNLVAIIGLSTAFWILLTFIYWRIASRHVMEFFKNSSTLINEIKKGNYNLPPVKKPQDEFGDLLNFIEGMAKSLEESLGKIRESEEKYRGLLENISDWVWETDARGMVTYSSPAIGKMLETGSQSLKGNSIASILCSDGHSGESEKCLALLNSFTPAVGVLSNTFSAGKEDVYLESNWDVLASQSGEILGLRGVSRDVTYRVIAEKEKQKLQNQLMHAQKMEALGTLSGGIAHDFNNILQAISGWTDLVLGRDNLDERDKNSLAKILDATEHAGRLTQQLLFYSRRINTQFKKLDLNYEVERARNILGRTIPKSIEIISDLKADLPMIMADPVQVEQVVINFVINARDAMPEGGTINIKTWQVASPEPYGGPAAKPGELYVALSVSDTGLGIPKEYLNRIYEPFFTTKEFGKGTGLGLATVYGIVKSHNAVLHCETAPGKGTTFTVVFPGVERDEADSPQPTVERRRSACRSLNVLVVDDEESIRSATHEALLCADFKVQEAHDGETALVLYDKNPAIDVVILDLNMPGMGGVQCLRKLVERNEKVKVIVATGFSESELRDGFVRSHMAGFLRKPYRLNDLLNEIHRVMDEG